jgi:hypothetical protein
MAQKTLKQLLGSSGEREQVDLNLDEATFRAPNVAAGQYSVQVQQTLRADQTQAGQLANALGRYAGPIARQYQGIEQQRQEEYAQVASLLTPEQAKAVAAGDIEPLREQFKQTADKLDSAQRKKFLKFVENPNNYIRASRVLGKKVASFVETDLIENKDKFIQSETDISTQMQETIQTIASSKDYNLTGFALEGFMEKANNIAERYTPRLIEEQDDYKEEQYIANGIDSLAQTAKNGDFESFVSDFNETFNASTPAEQAAHLSSAVSLVSSVDPLQAQALVGFIEDKLIFGNQAAVSEGVINDLNEQIEQQIVSRNEFENRQKAALKQETNKNVANALLQIQNGDPVEPFFIKLFNGEDLEVNIDGVTSAKDLYERLAKTVYSSEMASDADKAVYSTEFLSAANEIALKEETRNTSLGADNAVKEVTRALEANIAGVNMFDLDAVGIQEQADEFNEQLREGIDAIYADPSLNDGQKVNRSASFIRQQTAERLRDLEARVTEEKMTQFVDNAVSDARLKPNQAFVNDLERDILEGISLGFTPDASQIEFAKNQAKSLVEPIREEAMSILKAPFTSEEKANISQAWIDRQAKIEELKDSVDYETALNLYNQQQEEEKRQQEEKSQQEEKRKQGKTIIEKFFGTQESERYNLNYDGDLGDSPNGYQKDGILFHPDGQNYKGKYPSGILYNKGVTENSKYRKLADQVEPLRNKLIEQIEGTRRVIVSDPKDKRLTISYTGEKYMKSLYGQRTVINGEPAVTANEIRSGMLEGKIPFDTTKIKLDVMPILSPDMINNPDEYEDVILDYASALNVPKEKIGSFLFKQAQALSSRGIIFKTNTNTKKED